MHSARRHPSSPPGFSLLELLVVASLCAIVFTTGSLAFRAVAQNQRRATTFQSVTLTSAVAGNFFPGTTSNTINSYTAPNYGRATTANLMRNLFYQDTASSCAVFALPRTGNINEIRERILTIGSRQPADYDTPAKFLMLLNSLTTTSAQAAVFNNYRGAPADSITTGTVTDYQTNGTVFVLQPSGSTDQLWVQAVYEIDYVAFTDTSNGNMPCVHASVRRYVDSGLTNFYDIIYPQSTLAEVGVPFVHFERAVRSNLVESSVTKWKIAGNQPFYLMWWPDPAMPRLKGTAVFGGTPTYATSTVQADYAKHEGQTSFTFVVPQFPCY